MHRAVASRLLGGGAIIARCATLAFAAAAIAATSPGYGAEFRSTVDAATILYDAPSNKSSRLFVVGRAYPLEVMVSLEGWIKVRDAGGTIAWVEGRALAPKRTVMVKVRVAEVRSAPEDSAGITFRAAQNVVLEWVETLPSGWTQVRHAASGTGYVRTADIWGA